MQEPASPHDRKCVICGKPFKTEAKRGRPFQKCPECRKPPKKSQ